MGWRVGWPRDDLAGGLVVGAARWGRWRCGVWGRGGARGRPSAKGIERRDLATSSHGPGGGAIASFDPGCVATLGTSLAALRRAERRALVGPYVVQQQGDEFAVDMWVGAVLRVETCGVAVELWRRGQRIRRRRSEGGAGQPSRGGASRCATTTLWKTRATGPPFESATASPEAGGGGGPRRKERQGVPVAAATGGTWLPPGRRRSARDPSWRRRSCGAAVAGDTRSADPGANCSSWRLAAWSWSRGVRRRPAGTAAGRRRADCPTAGPSGVGVAASGERLALQRLVRLAAGSGGARVIVDRRVRDPGQQPPPSSSRPPAGRDQFFGSPSMRLQSTPCCLPNLFAEEFAPLRVLDYRLDSQIQSLDQGQLQT